MRGRSAWLYYEELGDVTPDEERGVDGKTEAELEAEFAQDDDRNQREEMSMDYFLRIEDLGRLVTVLGERISAEGVPTCDEDGCNEAAFGMFPDERLRCEFHAETEAMELAAADIR